MEIVAHRMGEGEIGPKLAAGRDATVYAVGEDKVLRRSGIERSYEAEAQAMEAIRALGYPVPTVHQVGPSEMVLDRITGPTMLEDLGTHPWRADAHARLLAGLHHRLHRLAAPELLRPFPIAGDAILHLDLHPGNVILSPDGPVVIDWTNVRRGPAPVDVALTWIILAVFESDDTGVMKALVWALRRRYAKVFLQAAGRKDAARYLQAAADHRGDDRNIRPAERERLQQLVATFAT